ncbi:YceI family protein [Chitinophaga horti]|uniref:YceI family protein n=1 Tax=Chitinophaga horti TaxID=2920382 RepID=A0ABY6IXW1_9BACT|nr:YceI family protein [Chitinophaga horti]UYQ92232.1 YceI family protein [Chitinophaga horti]
MKKITFIAASLVFSVSAFAQTWKLDAAHSRVGFSLVHMGVNEFHGSFKQTDAVITSSKADFTDATIEIKAEVANINTDNSQRDQHLQKEDMLDAAKFNAIAFKSTTFKKTGAKTYDVAGELTFHGVTKPVTLKAELVGTTTHPMNKKEIAGFKVTGSFKRSDFGVAPGMPEAMLSDVVKIEADTEFIKG